MDVDAALAEVRRRAAGRTRYEGQPRPVDELLAEEVERLRAKLRALSGPLPSDPDGRMWSTLNYFANREDDDIDTEVMGWAMGAITGLRARVAELEAALVKIMALAQETINTGGRVELHPFEVYIVGEDALGDGHG